MLPLARPRLYWLLQSLGWGLWGLMGVALVSLFGQFSGTLVAIEALVVAVMLGSSHLLRAYLRRHHWVRLAPARLLLRLPAAIGATAVGSLAVIAVLTTALLHGLGQRHGSFPWVDYVGYFCNVSLALGLWLAVYFGLHYLASYRQAEVARWQLAAAAREAEMRTLQAQLNPHFLFNGLNNIRALVMEDPGRARAMMTHLAELLRYTMQRNGAEQVPLATELEIVEDYLQLEAMQLEERLRYTLDVAPEARAVPLPPMTVQLLVENAIKHGLSPRPDGGSIGVSAQLAAGGTELHLAVRSTGCYCPAPGHPGVGLRNVRERLGLLFGPAASFRIGPDPLLPDTVLAEISLPAFVNQALSHERAAH